MVIYAHYWLGWSRLSNQFNQISIIQDGDDFADEIIWENINNSFYSSLQYFITSFPLDIAVKRLTLSSS